MHILKSSTKQPDSPQFHSLTESPYIPGCCLISAAGFFCPLSPVGAHTGGRGHFVYAHWRYNGDDPSSYTIKAVAGAGGSISPTGNVSVREGADQAFTITPDKGYTVSNVKIDSNSIGAVKSYTFENVSKAHTIEVIFVKDSSPQTGVFVDVSAGSYYEDAVDWAAENGIAKGTSHTTFSPNAACTRAQAVTFLWRSEKSPAGDTVNPFTDVKSTDYYADAVLWAVREQITKGTGNTTFSPNANCTRGQIVTLLWRCKK